ncbi:fc0d8b8b-728d-4e9f-9c6f-8e1c4cdfa648-CDS [Sclerotinia trifoliorum]|uniref:Fc0d8b8b-728d-4e9f-9c6f-8e1c4cdfa648-CDS n=1 Tax=Sclerotinia trifoliorum TaxID=28548 RepID=A0A8H2ZV32_9HELO|nr:fc0d8b8b-728d-4e9f-9c6f-8e1c4cdfa648-CDS [Sclerotinia trifoliorum]
MKYDDMVSIFKGRSFSWWIPIICTSNVLAGIAAWVIFHGPPPESVPLDFFYSFTMLIILGNRSSKRPNKRPYNVAMRDLVTRIECATIMTILSCWAVVAIFKALSRDLRPLSEENSGGEWAGLIVFGFFTLLFYAGVLAATWLPISSDELGDLYDPVATDEESIELSSHKEPGEA